MIFCGVYVNLKFVLMKVFVIFNVIVVIIIKDCYYIDI